MSPHRTPLVVLVVAIGLVGLVSSGVAVGAGADATDDVITVSSPTLTATEVVNDTADSGDATPVPTTAPTGTDDGTTLLDALNDSADTTDPLLEDTTADLTDGTSLPDGPDVLADASTAGPTTDSSGADTTSASPTAADAPASATDGPSTSAETAVAAPARGAPTGSSGVGPVTPLTGGALVGGAVVLTGLAGRTVLGGPDDSTVVDAAATWARLATSRLLAPGWRDRLWPALGLFGYQRYADSDPLEHDGRARLHGLVQADPGIHLSAVSEAAGLPLSTARYHLRVLEHEGLARGVKLRGKRRYFPPDVEAEALVAALADDATGAVLRSLVRQGPASVSRLAERLERDPSTVSHHLDRLADDGLVDREREERAVISTATPAVEAAVDRLGTDEGQPADPRPAATSD